MECIAKTMHGLEEILVKELEAIGAKNCKTLKRAVSFEGDLAVLYKANLHCRTALRILKQSYSFTATDAKELYDKIKELPWEEHMGLSETLAIDSSVNSEHFQHSKYASLKMKDAIVDRFRLKFGSRPDVDPVDADLNLHLHIYQDKVNISLDSSGDSLHRRGYRSSGHMSPLNEVLAAGMIMLSGWTKEDELYDPMCGTGTIAIEAAMLASNTPPGWLKPFFGFMRWKDYDEDLWMKIREEAEAKIDKAGIRIKASDISGIHVRMARTAAESTGLDECIEFFKGDFFEQGTEEGVVMMNPPYGERMQHHDIEEFYELMADHLKTNFSGTSCWFISSNNDALLRFGLRPSQKIVLFNGPLECRFQRFDLYAGSKKAKYQESNIDRTIREMEEQHHTSDGGRYDKENIDDPDAPRSRDLRSHKYGEPTTESNERSSFSDRDRGSSSRDRSSFRDRDRNSGSEERSSAPRDRTYRPKERSETKEYSKEGGHKKGFSDRERNNDDSRPSPEQRSESEERPKLKLDRKSNDERPERKESSDPKERRAKRSEGWSKKKEKEDKPKRSFDTDRPERPKRAERPKREFNKDRREDSNEPRKGLNLGGKREFNK